jgi:hypothetical protein
MFNMGLVRGEVTGDVPEELGKRVWHAIRTTLLEGLTPKLLLAGLGAHGI